MIASPAATNTTAAPIAKNATDVADSCAGATDTLFNIAVSPSPINAKAPTIPIITPIATPPELACPTVLYSVASFVNCLFVPVLAIAAKKSSVFTLPS